ncbi:GNAT family N-acetyltransferase [Rudanella paleaurantiibacter]|uniref:GNAT family N-acetyltransferase n=1 Tax=Rudanella paleaurantiibacter TaxID=2614655 RepID=A0A7J5U3G4_9BACT|nr:GNAT family N-acetyltransferase [Rudanella paleaurantiibacter]KAB7731575.1 GNAT family N-acetyltransferase [Rudanella paleaurantiibacter]
MKTALSIQTAQPTEYAPMLAVWERSVRATHHFLTEADIEFFRPLVREAFGSGRQLVCAHDTTQTVLGFAGVADGKLEMLFVDPDWRGQGVGGRLLRYAVTELGARALDVNEQNEGALGFYQKAGFVITGRSPLDGLGKPFPLLHMQLGL